MPAAAAAQQQAPELTVVRRKVGEIPVLVIAPQPTAGRSLVIWLPGFSGTRDSSEAFLRRLAARGYVALSFDCYQHGERRIESQDELVRRVRGNIRRYFWPILARSAEEVPGIIDWAVRELGVRPRVGIGGTSMGGDIAVAAAGVDRRIRAVSACVATPDWMRPGSFEPPGCPDAEAQAAYDRRNPSTHLDAYDHRPAIAFQSGAHDRQVPAEPGLEFVAALKKRYGKDGERLEVFLYPGVPHRIVPEMLDRSLDWFDRHLKQE